MPERAAAAQKKIKEIFLTRILDLGAIRTGDRYARIDSCPPELRTKLLLWQSM